LFSFPLLAGLPSRPFTDANVLSIDFFLDSGARYSTLTPITFARLSSHFGDDVHSLLVPDRIFDILLLNNRNRVSATGNWLLLYVTMDMSQCPHPTLFFVGENVANVLAVTSTIAARWLVSRLPLTLPPIVPDGPFIWQPDALINITRRWGLDHSDRRLFSFRTFFIASEETLLELDFFLDTGSPINLWPAIFHAPSTSSTALHRSAYARSTGFTS